VGEEEQKLEGVAADQALRRAELAEQRAGLDAERAELLEQRESSAAQLERTLRIRYDRLRRARASAVVVPLSGDACGACFTAVPRNRRSQIRAGALLEGCEACGVILYATES
jgi:predicted  nucleic acid-binding Zn-ribbon protein